MSQLFLLSRIGNTDWDETRKILVRAENEAQARQMAFQGAHKDKAFLSKEKFKATVITSNGPSQIIIEDFIRG